MQLSTIDKGFSWALIVLSAGHGILGTLLTSDIHASTTVWSFSGSVAAWMIAAVNILRVGRPKDWALSWLPFSVRCHG